MNCNICNNGVLKLEKVTINNKEFIICENCRKFVTFLDTGFYFDAIGASPWDSNKVIIRKILVLKEKYVANTEILELLLNAERYLKAERNNYEEKILPCMDYIKILLTKRYGDEAAKTAIESRLLTLKNIEQKIKESSEPNLCKISNELFFEIIDLLKTSNESKKLESEVNTFVRDVFSFLKESPCLKKEAIAEIEEQINKTSFNIKVKRMLMYLQMIKSQIKQLVIPDDLQLLNIYIPEEYKRLLIDIIKEEQKKVKSLLEKVESSLNTGKRLDKEITKLLKYSKLVMVNKPIDLHEKKYSTNCIYLYDSSDESEIKIKLKRDMIEKVKENTIYEALSSICSKNEEIVKKIEILTQEISQIKDKGFLSGLFGIISGRKNKVLKLKEESLNLVKEIYPNHIDFLKTKYDTLSEREMLSVIYKELIAIKDELKSEINIAIKIKDELKSEINWVRTVDNLITEGMKIKNCPLYKKLKHVEKDTPWVILNLGPKQKLIHGGNKREILVWDIHSTNIELVMCLEGLEATVTTLCAIHDKDLLISGGSDGQIILWNLTNGDIIKKTKASEKGVSSILLAPDGRLVSGGGDEIIKIWKLPELDLETALEGHEGGVNCLFLTTDGKLISGGTICVTIWNLKERKIMKKIKRYGAEITCLSISPDNRILALGEKIDSQISQIILWDIEEFRMKDVLEGHRGPVKGIVFTKDGMLISEEGIGNMDNSKFSDIFIWSLNTGEILAKIQGHTGSMIWDLLKINTDLRCY